jgi:predicted helicase
MANSNPARVYHADLWGTRRFKEEQLSRRDLGKMSWKECRPARPFYLFVPQDTGLLNEYEQGWMMREVMPVNVLGFQTHRDHFAVDFEKSDLFRRISAFRSAGMTDDGLMTKYGIADKGDWKISEARAKLRANKNWEELLIKCAYRPFDFRFCYLSEVAMDRPRRELIDHVAGRNNICLGLGRQGIAVNDPQWSLISVSKDPIDANIFRRGGINVFPLYLYPYGKTELALNNDRRPNFSLAFLKALSEKVRLPQEEPFGLPKGIAPEDIFNYAYAIFHSPTYRTRYAEFLKIDFPRLPLTSDLKLFRSLAAQGAGLVALHLLESPKVNEFISGFPEKGDNIVEKIRYTDNNRRVWINKSQYFSGVTKAVWEFYIGGYQVCEKWLKDRKGRKLSYDDIQHYQKIVVALDETIRLMAKIDALIPSWPII